MTLKPKKWNSIWRVSRRDYGEEYGRVKRKAKNKNRNVDWYKREKVVPTDQRGTPGSNEVEKV